MLVKTKFKLAELKSGVITPGHYYYYKNDSAHFNHVHVAFMPWGEPDSPGSNPKDNCPQITDPCKAYMAAFVAKFGTKFKYGGACVRKHRNSSLTQPWSQHTFGNAVDYMANGSAQDEIINWLESEYKEDDLTDEQAAQLKRIDDFIADLKGGGDAGISANALADNGDFIRGFRNRFAFETGADPTLTRPTDTWAARGWDCYAEIHPTP